MRAHVRVAAQEQDPAQQRVGVLGLLLHLVVEALVQREQTLVLVAARVDEVLVARGKFATQQFLQAFNDVGMAFHGGAPVNRWGPWCPIPDRRDLIGISCMRRRRWGRPA
ncbi:hypothetical protein D9M73_296630 [compost metagenome]